MGDIVGEKSIFAAGKEKLSSILASKKKPPKPPQSSQVGVGTILKPPTPEVSLGGEELDILGDEQIGPIEDTKPFKKTDTIMDLLGY